MNQTSFEFRLLSSLDKIFPHYAPDPMPVENRLCAMGGETVSLQVAYMQSDNYHRNWARLRVEAPPSMSVNIRRVRYMPGHIPTKFRTDEGYLRTKSGLYPDLLEPVDATRLPLLSGVWQGCWIDFNVAPKTDAGSYRIKINMEDLNGETLGEAVAEVDVAQTDLPPLGIYHTMWFHTDCLADYYGVEVFSERHWEIIENFASYAVKHSINTLLTPIHTPPLDTAVGGERTTVQLIDVEAEGGEYTFGFDKLERWVSMCKRIGVEYYEMAHLFSQWGAKHAPKIMGTKDGKYTRLFGWETDAASDEYSGYLRQLLPALVSKLKEWGIAERTIFHISDEPNLDQLDVYLAARKIVEPYLEGFKIVDALTNYDFYKQGVVTVPVPSVDHITPFLEGGVPELWCYYCCSQSHNVPNHFFMLPGFRHRMLGVLIYKFNIAGFLHWGYNFYNCVQSKYPINPFIVTDADGAFPSGDAFIVYPGADGKPMASQRLMNAQEAFNDFRALKRLEEFIGREAVLELIDEGLQTPITFESFPQTKDYLFSLRKRLNKEIAKRGSAN